MNKYYKKMALILIVPAVSIGFGTATVIAGVSPDSVEVVLAPGDSETIDKDVSVPDYPDKLDLMLMVDLSGSYWNDLPNINSLAPNIFDGVRADITDSNFGLASFIDFPYNPWGHYNGDGEGWAGPDDFAYSLDQDFTGDKTTWTSAIGALTVTTGAGFDGPESQYYALEQAALETSWRSDATGVIAITTDAPFHLPEDGPCYGPNPPCNGTYYYEDAGGPSRDEAIAALAAKNIKVIAIKAPGSGSEMDDLATTTGGSVQTTGSTSAEIATAILNAFEELTFNVTADTSDCDPGILDISYAPAVQEEVLAGTSVEFAETVTVKSDIDPADIPEDLVYCCDINFEADDDVIGTQELCVQIDLVPIDIKPTSCPNPANVSTKGNGVLPVAIIGTADFDVTQVDPETVRLEGVAPLRWSIEDVATPYDIHTEEGCMDCTTDGPDGIYDLTLKFKQKDVYGAIGEVYNRECKTLRLTGELFSGYLIVGEDKVIILKND
jgi:hypothetical protein